jgi:hypothetical protein
MIVPDPASFVLVGFITWALGCALALERYARARKNQ